MGFCAGETSQVAENAELGVHELSEVKIDSGLQQEGSGSRSRRFSQTSRYLSKIRSRSRSQSHLNPDGSGSLKLRSAGRSSVRSRSKSGRSSERKSRSGSFLQI